MFSEPLMATCWTTAGNAAPDRPDLRSPIPLRERVEAASRAGFRGFGLLSADLPEAERVYGLSGIASLLADNGITHLELEGIPHWWSDGPQRTESDEIRQRLLRAAEALGARHIKITPDDGDQPRDFGHYVAEFGRLAAQAADSGTRLGIEFLPWSTVKTIDDALRLVDEAGHDAAGVIIDIWHTERGGTPPSELASVPLERIIGVELNDADEEVIGTLVDDTINRRRYCGDGSFDLAGVISALHSAGWRGPWGIEILSPEHRALSVDAASKKSFDTGVDVLARTLGQG